VAHEKYRIEMDVEEMVSDEVTGTMHWLVSQSCHGKTLWVPQSGRNILTS
jgi:hypothetical protein